MANYLGNFYCFLNSTFFIVKLYTWKHEYILLYKGEIDITFSIIYYPNNRLILGVVVEGLFLV